MENDFSGIKNVSGDKIRQKYDGKWIDFDKDEVKVLPIHSVSFLSTRSKYYSVEGQKGLNLKMLFKVVPLAEALKLAKAPENRSIAEAKAALETEEKKKADLRVEILKALKEEGWTAPKAKP